MALTTCVVMTWVEIGLSKNNHTRRLTWNLSRKLKARRTRRWRWNIVWAKTSVVSWLACVKNVVALVSTFLLFCSISWASCDYNTLFSSIFFITLTTDKTRVEFSFHAPQLLIDDCAAGRSVLSDLCIILNLTLMRRRSLDVHSRWFADLDWKTVKNVFRVINRDSNTCLSALSVTIKLFFIQKW